MTLLTIWAATQRTLTSDDSSQLLQSTAISSELDGKQLWGYTETSHCVPCLDETLLHTYTTQQDIHTTHRPPLSGTGNKIWWGWIISSLAETTTKACDHSRKNQVTQPWFTIICLSDSRRKPNHDSLSSASVYSTTQLHILPGWHHDSQHHIKCCSILTTDVGCHFYFCVGWLNIIYNTLVTNRPLTDVRHCQCQSQTPRRLTANKNKIYYYFVKPTILSKITKHKSNCFLVFSDLHISGITNNDTRQGNQSTHTHLARPIKRLSENDS